MAADVHSREQRLRKQAELQSLHLNLANLREREASYIAVSAALPELLINQINEVRHEVRSVEDELLALGDESIPSAGRQFYREAFEAELVKDLDKALKLYKSASRYGHPDASAAVRSVRYLMKVAKNRATSQTWTPMAANQSRNQLLLGLAVLLILGVIVALAFSRRPSAQLPQVAAVESTVTPTPPAVILIIPDTATPLPTAVPSPTSTSTPTPTNTPLSSVFTEFLPTETPSPTATLRAAPKIVGPQNGLVWKDGAIVFEFEDLNLPYNELYCLNTLRGFDQTRTENWSFPPIGNKEPAIPIEANVFRIAKAQDIRCIVWSASIGRESCENIISESTQEQVIGLPQPCKLD